jgi:hypothetical protein
MLPSAPIINSFHYRAKLFRWQIKYLWVQERIYNEKNISVGYKNNFSSA